MLCAVIAATLVCFAVAAGSDATESDSEPTRELFRLDVDKPGGLAFDGELLWVTDRVAQKLRGLDPKSGKQRAEIEAPGPWPTGLAFDGELLWVSDRQRNRMFGIDLKSKIVEREVESPENPLGLAFDGKHLWVADGKRIHQVMREDGTTIVSFNAPPWPGEGRGKEQLGLAFHEGYLWISDRKADRIYQVEPERGDVVDMMPSPGPFPAGLAVVDGRLLIADVDKGAVEALELGAMPRVVRRQARHQKVVFRRRITNRGPGTVAEANIYIAVPHSVPSQALDGEPVFDPEPTSMVEDRWGQRFAHYTTRNLRPGKSLDVEMTVEATLFAVRYHIDPDRVGGLRSIPRDVRKTYLADAAKFALDHPSIKTHLKNALGDEKRPYWMVRKIARYIGEHMEYELAGGWNIAPTVIDRGTGSCSEYTFVFIAMCRAAGIPARYAGAVVVRGDNASTDDVFHRWAEVYLPGYGWVPADAQAADKPSPEQQGYGLGSLSNRFLITTWGGGDSKYIGWDYNSKATWTCRGRCEIEDLHLGDWYPVAADATAKKK
jgi:transglutaminase-like putative cysteine protease/sugar lactone lactonase YvrE